MNFMIVLFMLIGAANLSCQSPISARDIDPIFLELQNAKDNDLVLSENHIFRPYFRLRQRQTFRRRTREAHEASPEIQEIPTNNLQELSINGPISNHYRITRSAESDLSRSDDDDLQVAENHIFLPVFRYKQRASYRRRVKKPTNKNNRG
ncbi:hypothetical protein DMENIID0001_050540 [Sergentomyia squamirostris]